MTDMLTARRCLERHILAQLQKHFDRSQEVGTTKSPFLDLEGMGLHVASGILRGLREDGFVKFQYGGCGVSFVKRGVAVSAYAITPEGQAYLRALEEDV